MYGIMRHTVWSIIIQCSKLTIFVFLFSFKSQLESIKPNQTACDICLGNVQRAAKYCRTCSASFCVSHLADHYKAPAFSSHELGSFEQTSKVPLEKDSPINLSISGKTWCLILHSVNRICIERACGTSHD